MGELNIPFLLQAIDAGSQIIFSSTSCGYMIRSEYPGFFQIPGADRVAEHTFDIFEFLARLKEAGTLKRDFRDGKGLGGEDDCRPDLRAAAHWSRWLLFNPQNLLAIPGITFPILLPVERGRGIRGLQSTTGQFE